jgi:hypothetical protein
MNSLESSHFHESRSHPLHKWGSLTFRTSPLSLDDSDVEKRSDFGATKQHARLLKADLDF